MALLVYSGILIRSEKVTAVIHLHRKHDILLTETPPDFQRCTGASAYRGDHRELSWMTVSLLSNILQFTGRSDISDSLQSARLGASKSYKKYPRVLI